MKRYPLFMSLLCMALLFSACSGNENAATTSESSRDDGFVPVSPRDISENETVANVSFHRKIATHMNDETGWWFSFEMEEDAEDPSNRIYVYVGFNMRYRYKGNYWTQNIMQDMNSDGSPWYKLVKARSGRMNFGEGGEEEWRDRKILNKMLAFDKTPEELLAINPDDYTFEVLDKDLFFRLMHTALEGDYVPEGPSLLYWSKPHTGMSVEPYFVDGYKFQIAFAQKNTFVDEIYIDVLYQTGEAFDEYKQLSDMVDSGEASAEQKEAFELIQSIRKAIKEQNWYIADAEKWKEKEIGGIDFSRLYSHLEAIHRSDFSFYSSRDDIPWITETLTKEEYDALKKEYSR